MTIRAAREEDLPALSDIHDAAILETDSTCYLSPLSGQERWEWWEEHQDPRHRVLVAERAGRVRGYASLSLWLAGPIYAHTVEASVFLASDARGQGTGTRLLQALLVEAGRQGHHVVIARVWETNAASLALCRKCGFERVGVQREVGWRRGAWEGCVVLQVVLPTQGAGQTASH